MNKETEKMGTEKQSHHREELKELLEEYKDVFPEEIPKGLPPKRSVEMKIDVEQNAKPKMGPIYKLSKKELEEMKKQLEEALGHGFIRPIISPWGKSDFQDPRQHYLSLLSH